MSTGKTFKIKTLQDIFSLPDADMMERCLKELTGIMISTRATADLLKHCAEHAAKQSGKEVKLPPDCIQWPEFCDWTDDGGLVGSRIGFVAPNGEKLMELRVEKSDKQKGDAQ